jgi:hypothetical protein
MTDHDTGGATEAQHDDDAFGESDSEDEPPTPTHEASAESTGNRVIEALQWAAFAILILVALVATFRFYFAASNAISNFVTHEYRPLFQAIFNLVILLASGLGLSVLVRRIA